MAFFPSISVLTSVFKGADFLTEFFQNLREQTVFPELELILVLNEPSPTEKRLVKDFQLRSPDQVQVLFAHERETLGASWNRGWKTSRAPYLAMWNVDDRRTIDSLQRQLSALEEHPEWWVCYGDYMTVQEYGSNDGIRRSIPVYNSVHFRRYFAQGGAFWLLRRNISETLGNFDEQFTVGPDMEYSFRIAMKDLEMGKCDGMLGYFTDAAKGLSTRDGAKWSIIERTAIQLRYGVFDKVDRTLIKETGRYRLDEIKLSGLWIPITTYLPNLRSYLSSRKPLWIIGSLRFWFRSIMKRLGLLERIHKAQEKYLKREI
jgi:GT2 family glycosyltransferase